MNISVDVAGQSMSQFKDHEAAFPFLVLWKIINVYRSRWNCNESLVLNTWLQHMASLISSLSSLPPLVRYFKMNS